MIYNLIELTKIFMNINVYIFFSEELTEDKDLKNIIFLSKDLIKLSNLCEKKQKAVALKWHKFVISTFTCFYLCFWFILINMFMMLRNEKLFLIFFVL